MKYSLPPLPYPYDALEPYIDATTMEIHHTKHHQAYVDKLNQALEGHPELQERSLEDLLRNIDQLPPEIRQPIINHGGGHLNHSLFWQILGPEKEIDEELLNQIETAFGSLKEFKEKFTQTALSHFGSGWAWLVKTAEGKLEVYSLPNQDSPYLKNHTPLIGLDVWEHAYYLKYQNRRGEYINAWWKVLKLLP